MGFDCCGDEYNHRRKRGFHSHNVASEYLIEIGDDFKSRQYIAGSCDGEELRGAS